MAVTTSLAKSQGRGLCILDLDAVEQAESLEETFTKARESARFLLVNWDRIFPQCRDVPQPQPAVRTRVVSRPREHRPTGGRGAHAPPEDDPEPRWRPCACGCSDAARPNSKYASEAHAIRARVRQHRERQAEWEGPTIDEWLVEVQPLVSAGYFAGLSQWFDDLPEAA